MNWKILLLLVASFILYLVIGALVFSALETTNEEETKVDLRQYKDAILSNRTCLSPEDLETLIMKIVTAIDNGVNPVSNVTSQSNWDFSSSFFFSGTIVTTIGYGNISPSTSGGRSFCIIYALIGIPLFGILMAGITEKLKHRLLLLEKRVGERLIQHPKIKSSVYAIVLLTICIVFFMIIPACIFTVIEKWTFPEAFYYAFITLTTIGFGDFVVGTNPDTNYSVLYKWCTYIWIVIGLAVLALIIAFISDMLTDTADKIQQKQVEKMQQRKGGEEGSEEVEGESNGEKKSRRDDSAELEDMNGQTNLTV